MYETLARAGVHYQVVEHEPVYTIEEMERLDFPAGVEIAKNLFLRDGKGKRHFLVVLHKNKNADLRGLGEKLNAGKLSFASEQRLEKHLGLGKGAVSPFGALNDDDRAVEVVFDRDLAAHPLIGVHPNDNTATVILSCPDLLRVVEEHGNALLFV